jgi:pyrroloquinoline quinone biosynthesis protein B
MRVRILGSGAGGGVPQWNCGCDNCRAVRAGAPDMPQRTQDSIALSALSGCWVLCNAAPDVRQQIEAFHELHPRRPRHSPIAAIVLTNGDLDHVLGLFSLRESYPLVVYATEAVRRGLVEHNALLRTLQRFEGQVSWRRLDLHREQPILDRHGEATGIWLTARPIKGKPPVHLEGIAPHSEEQNVGLWLRDQAGATLAYVSAAAELDGVAPYLDASHTLLLDGTFWSSDELSAPGLSPSRAEDMAHLPIGGARGSLAATPRLPARTRVFTHINNTNPMLRPGSPEREAVEAQGWRIAWDGMELDLTADVAALTTSREQP